MLNEENMKAERQRNRGIDTWRRTRANKMGLKVKIEMKSEKWKETDREGTS